MLYYVIIIFSLTIVYVSLLCSSNIKTRETFNKIDTKQYQIYYYDDDCLTRCGDVANCLRLKEQTKNYLKCKKCKKDKKIYRKNLIGYQCEDESFEDNYKDEGAQNINREDDLLISQDSQQKGKLCSSPDLSCPNYKNISGSNMIQPYYFLPRDTSQYLSNSNLCEFCWNLN